MFVIKEFDCINIQIKGGGGKNLILPNEIFSYGPVHGMLWLKWMLGDSN